MGYQVLIRNAHRNAYECLWSEHRVRVLAVSYKKYRLASSKLGKTPQYLGLLRLLNEVSFYKQSDYYYAILALYDELKDSITRNEKVDIVNNLLGQDSSLLEKIYELGKIYKILSIQGSRIFYPNKAINKFFDHASFPGLWILLGPKLIHLNFYDLRKRIETRLNIESSKLDDLFYELKNGISTELYLKLDFNIRDFFENHCLVAITNTKVWLNYAIPVPLPKDEKSFYLYNNSTNNNKFSDFELYSYMVLENIWDSYKGLMPQLPNYSTFQNFWRSNIIQEIIIPNVSDDIILSYYKSIQDDFERQKNIEKGIISE